MLLLLVIFSRGAVPGNPVVAARITGFGARITGFGVRITRFMSQITVFMYPNYRFFYPNYCFFVRNTGPRPGAKRWAWLSFTRPGR